MVLIVHSFDSGFEVTEEHIDPGLLDRIRTRLPDGNVQTAMIKKLLRHMILDFETVKLVSRDDLTGEARMNADEVRALMSDDAEWQIYRASGARTRDAKPDAFNDELLLPMQSQRAPGYLNAQNDVQAPTRSAPVAQGAFAPAASAMWPQQTGGGGAFASKNSLNNSFGGGQPLSSQPLSKMPAPVVNTSLAGGVPSSCSTSPAPQMQVSGTTQVSNAGGGGAGSLVQVVEQPPSPAPPPPAARSERLSMPEAQVPSVQAAYATPGVVPSDVNAVAAPPLDGEDAEPDVDSAPDSDDTDFIDLVDYVVVKLYGDGDQSNVRRNKLEEILEDKDGIAEWKNQDARSNRAQLEGLKDIEGGSGNLGFRPQEMDMLIEILFKPRAASADAASSAVKPAAKGRPRVTGRPKAHTNFKYGEIRIIPSRQLEGYTDVGILKKWNEIEQFEAERGRKWGSNLTPLTDIVKAIDDYGKQAEWTKEGGDYTVRPIQGATLPVSLRGLNLIATAETGSGKTMCFAVAALAAIDASMREPQALIMAHNRTLLDQLCDEMDKLTNALKKLRPDKPAITWSFVDRSDVQKAFDPSAHVILSTAGQLAGKIKKRDINVSKIKLLVGDEVDDILGSSADAMRDILEGCERQSRKRPQVLFFSATIGDDDMDPDDVQLRRLLENSVGPQHVLCKAQRKDVAGMTHLIALCRNDDEKKRVLAYLTSSKVLLGSAIVFCKNKGKGRPVSVESLEFMDNEERDRKDLPPLPEDQSLEGVQVFHAGQEITKQDREKMMRRFKANEARILVATDAVAKGIDVPNVTMVVQMELVKAATQKQGFSWLKTQNKALDQFRHRAGRTARALQKGINVVLCTQDEERLAREYMRLLQIGSDNVRVQPVNADTLRDDEALSKFILQAQI